MCQKAIYAAWGWTFHFLKKSLPFGNIAWSWQAYYLIDDIIITYTFYFYTESRSSFFPWGEISFHSGYCITLRSGMHNRSHVIRYENTSTMPNKMVRCLHRALIIFHTKLNERHYILCIHANFNGGLLTTWSCFVVREHSLHYSSIQAIGGALVSRM